MNIDISFIEKDLRKVQRKDPENGKVVLNYLTYLYQNGHDVRRPKADQVRGKIFELRPNDYRILFAFLDQESAVALVLFKKKEPQIPPRQIELAEQRLNSLLP